MPQDQANRVVLFSHKFSSLHYKQVSYGWSRKCTPKYNIKVPVISKNAPQNEAEYTLKKCPFGQNHEYIAKFRLYCKNNTIPGWTGHRREGSFPVLHFEWKKLVLRTYENDTKRGPRFVFLPISPVTFCHFEKGKRQKAIYRLVTAPQGGTVKYTLDFAYESPRWLVK